MADIDIEMLLNKSYRMANGFADANDIYDELGYPHNMLRYVIKRGTFPPPTYVIGKKNMRVWDRKVLEGVPKHRSKENSVEVFTNCEINKATTALLRDTKKLFAVMNQLSNNVCKSSQTVKAD